MATPLDIILTGMPRSGLTLAGALIDSFENSVCLNEPLSHAAMVPCVMGNGLELGKWVVGDFQYLRTCITREISVPDIRANDGAALLDGLFDTRNPTTGDDLQRNHLMAYWPNIAPDFILAIKQHALYTAILPDLIAMGHFKIIAIIRNPVDVIISWQRLKGHVLSHGTLPPELYPFWQKTSEIGWSVQDVLTRMVQLYEMFCEQYYTHSEHITLIKYEDLIRRPSLISEAIGREGTPPAATFIKPSQQARDARQIEPIRERLRQYGVFTKQFYPDF